MRRTLVGIVWFVVIYFGACMLLGGIAGSIAGANNPAAARDAGYNAGLTVVTENRGYILLASLILVMLGTVSGMLPGTKSRPPLQSKSDA